MHDNDTFPLTVNQQDIWFDQLLSPGIPLYNIGGYVSIPGPVDHRAFQEAVDILVKETPALRLVMIEDNGIPCQRLLNEVPCQIPVIDLSDEKEPQTSALQWMEKDMEQLFQLYGGRLFDFALLKLSHQHYYWYIKYHHAIIDGWSISLITRRVASLYTSLVNNGSPGQTPFYSYLDYIGEDREYMASAAYNRHREFWLEMFRVVPDPLLQQRSKEEIVSARKSLCLDREFYNQLMELPGKYKVSGFHLMLAVLYTLFSRVYRNPDLVFGLPILNRRNVRHKNTIGLFTGITPLPIHLDRDMGFIRAMKAIKNELKRVFRNQRFPISQINKALKIHEQGRKQLFDISLSYEKQDYRAPFNGIDSETRGISNHFEQTPLLISIREFDPKLDVWVEFEYNRGYFADFDIDQLILHFNVLLKDVSAHPGKKIGELNFLSDREKEQILIDFNDTNADYPVNKTIIHLFEKQVEKTPDNMAVVGPPALKYRSHGTYMTYISYGEFNRKSNLLAHLLKEEGVKPDTIVGIMMERSLEMMMGIWAILKAGGAYLPIDPGYPPERIDYMLKDSGAEILLKDNDIMPQAFNNRPQGTFSPLHLSLAPATSLAYVIYTSGTTGKPKGVMISHHSLVNRLNWMQKKYPIDETDTILHKTPFSFDVSVWEIFGWSFTGARLCLLIPGGEKEPVVIIEAIRRNRVTIMHFVPSMLGVFLDYLQENGQVKKLSSLKQVIASGEALTLSHMKRFNSILQTENKTKLANLYGPTEATVEVSYFDCPVGADSTDMQSIPIGKPIDNMQLVILDKDYHLQPVGSAGELFIGGIGLARGYLNRPELTFERFVKNKTVEGKRIYRSHRSHRSHRFHRTYRTYKTYIYRTGDLCRWLPDGNIEFLGRIDNQVKIRGYRIECGEIESRLLQHPAVREAIVMAHEIKTGDKTLIAYIAAGEVNIPALREHLGETLPNYMIPARFICLERLPLTPNGKVDKRALPDPGQVDAAAGVEYVHPRNDTETLLVQLWQEVLAINHIGIHDNFFALGGDSLKAVRIASRLNMKGYAAGMADIFHYPEISMLAPYVKPIEISSLDREIQTPQGEDSFGLPPSQFNALIAGAGLDPDMVQDIYPLAPLQEGLLFYRLFNRESPAYFEQMSGKITGELDLNVFEKTWNYLLKRHDILRTMFVHEYTARPLQVVLKERRVEFKHENICTLSTTEQEAHWLDFKNKDRERSFDLTRDVLMRVSVFQSSLHEYRVVMSSHHIILDGWCMSILLGELKDIYRSFKEGMPLALPPVTPYSRYIRWLENPDRESSIKYWQAYLSGYEELTPLPKYADEIGRKGTEGLEHYVFSLDEETAAALSRLAANGNVTLNTLIQCVWAILLARYNRAVDVVFGTTVSGRPPGIKGIENMLGLFINTIPVRIRPVPGRLFKQLLKEVQDEALTGKSHHYTSLAQIQDCSMPGQGLFDHIIVFQDPAGVDPVNIQLEVPLGREVGISDLQLYEETHYDFTVLVFPGDVIRFRFSYNPGIYEPSLVVCLEGHLRRIIESILSDENILTGNISVLTREEKKKLLFEFNDTEKDYPRNKTIVHLFQEQVEKTPDNMAVVGPPALKYRSHGTYMTYISYRELNQKSNPLAHLLKEKGVKPDTIAGIMMERSVELMIAIWAILKAGGAYLPIDPAYPPQRIDYMLKDSTVGVLLTTAKLQVKVKAEVEENSRMLPQLPLQFINLETRLESAFEPSLSTLTSTLTCQVSPANLAYVIYTSGTTGKPKGVMISHDSLVNRLNWMQGRYPIDETDVILQKTPFSFDVSVWEIFWWSITGAGVCLLVPGGEKEPGAIMETVQRNKITIMHFVPSMLGAFLDYIQQSGEVKRLSGLKQVIASGEALTLSHLKRFNTILYSENKTKLANLYGPTEATIDVSYFDCPNGTDSTEIKSIPIGKPIDNIQLYVLDKAYHLQPVGSPGELFIAGIGLARGYLNRPGLTFERFIRNKTVPGKRIYRSHRSHRSHRFHRTYRTYKTYIYQTGDLCRWLPDGNIEFLGRIDSQVKIRGYRIECGEIESRLLQHPAVREAVVMAREIKTGEDALIAYITAGEVSIPELRDFVGETLPYYMIPSRFICLERLPLTANGKIDKRALPLPDPGEKINTGITYVAPGNKIEEQLAAVWSDILHLDRIGIHDDFFILGGDSMKLMRISNQLSEFYPHIFKMSDLFSLKTVKQMADYIIRKTGEEQQKAGEIEEVVYY